MPSVLLTLSLALVAVTPGVAASGAVPLIIDTDIGGGNCRDVDDVGAICLAHALADRGEAEILAIMQDSQPQGCAGAISALNQYYGRGDIPIGAYRGSHPEQLPALPYVLDLVEKFSPPINSSTQVPDAVDVYRRVLAGRPDHSVTISSIGLLTNLKALLQSAPDEHSLLSGYDLVARKVRLIVVMGGSYPSSGDICECNFCSFSKEHEVDRTIAEVSAYVVNHLPPEVEVIFNGFEVGVRVETGGALSTCAPATNPCRQAYVNYFDGRLGANRASWDPLATLMAVRGISASSCSECTSCSGTNWANATTGTNRWRSGPTSRQSYVVLEDPQKAAQDIDDLLCMPPKLEPPRVMFA